MTSLYLDMLAILLAFLILFISAISVSLILASSSLSICSSLLGCPLAGAADPSGGNMARFPSCFCSSSIPVRSDAGGRTCC
jgi:hypothetical protein